MGIVCYASQMWNPFFYFPLLFKMAKFNFSITLGLSFKEE